MLTNAPNVLPVGPLLSVVWEAYWAFLARGWNLHFLPEDGACMTWLNKQPDNSVIYVDFWCLTYLKPISRACTWAGAFWTDIFLVVCLDLTNETHDAYPEGFRGHVMWGGTNGGLGTSTEGSGSHFYFFFYIALWLELNNRGVRSGGHF